MKTIVTAECSKQTLFVLIAAAHAVSFLFGVIAGLLIGGSV